MSLLLAAPTVTTVDCGYKHKKFDFKRQRTSSEGNDLELTNYNNSSDSNCSTEFEAFQRKRTLRDTSTPLLKRIKLEHSELDSGIALMSPVKRQHNNLNDTSNDDIHASNNSTRFTPSPVATAILPRISDATLRDICKYHGNMVRKFPKKERTPKDQERRNKNTIACRMSRRVKKLEYIAIEEQYSEFITQHFKIVEESMRAAVYFKHISQLVKVMPAEMMASNSSVPSAPLPTNGVTNFSIDYLMGIN